VTGTARQPGLPCKARDRLSIWTHQYCKACRSRNDNQHPEKAVYKVHVNTSDARTARIK
jgi:hypothetical protein